MLKRFSDLLNSAADNLTFVLVCIIIFAGLFFLALLAERYFIKMERYRRRSKYIAYIAMMSTVAGVLMLFEIPLFFAPAFYEIDLSELPVLICTFALGPVAGVICELLKIIIKLVIKGTTTAFVGDFANFVVGCSLVLPASIIYHKHKSKKGAVIAMAGGTLTMTIFGSLFNAVYLIPTFSKLFRLPLDSIIAMGTAVNSNITSLTTLVLYAVVPFNLLKGIVVSVLTFLLYKRVSGGLHMKDTYVK